MNSHNFVACSGPSTRISFEGPSIFLIDYMYTVYILKQYLNRFIIVCPSSLRYLNGNQFTGTIPAQLTNLSLLTYLYAQGIVHLKYSVLYFALAVQAFDIVSFDFTLVANVT